jgi:hypothetical protein
MAMRGRVGRGWQACLALVLVGASTPAQARVTDPTAINRFDLRLDAGIASPVGMLGGAVNVPFRFFAVELSAGVGGTGLNLSLMPKIVFARWGRNQLLAGVGATVALPHEFAPMGRARSYWLTAEIAYQRNLFIDNVLYVAAGATRGSYLGQCLNENSMCPRQEDVTWPELRVGFGRRY